MVTSPCCKSKACRECYVTYLEGCPIQRCMNPECGKEFTREDIYEMFKPTDFKRLMKRAAELIVEVEQQYIIEYYNKEALNEVRKELFTQSSIMQDVLIPLRDVSANTDKIKCFLNRTTEEKIDEIFRMYKEQFRKLQTAYEKFDSMNKQFTNQYGEGAFETNKKYINLPCPSSDCDGITNFNWTCVKCNLRVCSSCGAVKKDDSHICVEDQIDSFKLIIDSSKPCPNCKSLIQKIEGCNQMFCTNCHAAFNWKTMEILNYRNVHNPHLDEYEKKMKEQGIDIYTMPNMNDSRDGWTLLTGSKYPKVIRLISEFLSDEVKILTSPKNVTSYSKLTNESARMSYIEGHITKEEFRVRCQRNMTLLDKRRYETEIRQKVCLAINDILKDYAANKLTARAAMKAAMTAVAPLTVKVYKTVDKIKSIGFLNVDEDKVPDLTQEQLQNTKK